MHTERQSSTWERGKIGRRRRIHTQKSKTITIIDTRIRIDLLPNYGPGTSKRYRKPVTTDNTVISNCEKRNFRRSSDLDEAKIYLFAVLVIFDMPSINHFFWSFCSQVGMTMVLEGFCGVFVFGLSALLYRDFDNVSDGLDLSKSGWSFLAT